MKLQVHKETAVRTPATRLKTLFDLVAEEEAEPGAKGRVNLVFTDDKRLRKLNREFRSKDKTTDVLSFNIDEPVDSQAIFGEIYISVPFARRQAEGYGGTLTEEILRLFCHGLLHLFGYDHQKPAETKRMEARHEAYLRQLDRRGRS
jgi:probable rRNA maturation factor